MDITIGPWWIIFEWVEGHLQRFGAYNVDFDDPNYPRRKTEMAHALQDIVAERGITEALWEKYVLPAYPTDNRESGGVTTSIDLGQNETLAFCCTAAGL